MDSIDKDTKKEPTTGKEMPGTASPENSNKSLDTLSDSDKLNDNMALVGKYIFYTLFWAVVVYSAYHYVSP